MSFSPATSAAFQSVMMALGAGEAGGRQITSEGFAVALGIYWLKPPKKAISWLFHHQPEPRLILTEELALWVPAAGELALRAPHSSSRTLHDWSIRLGNRCGNVQG